MERYPERTMRCLRTLKGHLWKLVGQHGLEMARGKKHGGNVFCTCGDGDVEDAEQQGYGEAPQQERGQGRGRGRARSGLYGLWTEKETLFSAFIKTGWRMEDERVQGTKDVRKRA
ncbi:hypothetical protein AOLI_G00283260 [Acnodon oligacanthus]